MDFDFFHYMDFSKRSKGRMYLLHDIDKMVKVFLIATTATIVLK